MSDSYMENALLKLARQINAYDEASLMSLWEKYADIVAHFEPTKRWEEAVIVFNLIQSVRLKNQLFNYNWAKSRTPDEAMPDLDLAGLTAPESPLRGVPNTELDDFDELDIPAPVSPAKKARKGKLLTLTPKNKK